MLICVSAAIAISSFLIAAHTIDIILLALSSVALVWGGIPAKKKPGLFTSQGFGMTGLKDPMMTFQARVPVRPLYKTLSTIQAHLTGTPYSRISDSARMLLRSVVLSTD
jgi:hypothetical protein